MIDFSVMDLKGIIKAKKMVLNDTTWHSGKLKKNDFPLSKNRGLKLGSQWEWRIITFLCLGCELRLLISFNSAKSSSNSWLGVSVKSDTVVLARIEFHATHGTWHVHTNCGNTENIIPGITGGNSLRKLSSNHDKPPSTKDEVYGYVTDRVKLFNEEFELES